MLQAHGDFGSLPPRKEASFLTWRTSRRSDVSNLSADGAWGAETDRPTDGVSVNLPPGSESSLSRSTGPFYVQRLVLWGRGDPFVACCAVAQGAGIQTDEAAAIGRPATATTSSGRHRGWTSVWFMACVYVPRRVLLAHGAIGTTPRPR